VLEIIAPGHFEGPFRERGVPAARRALAEDAVVAFDVPRVIAGAPWASGRGRSAARRAA
jgi:hypothetical protein